MASLLKAMAAQLAALREGKRLWGVLQGDCSTHLALIPDNTFDLVLTSPPYENRRYYRKVNFKRKGEEWVRWMVGIAGELARVCKGLVVINCQGQTDDYKWSAVPALLAADLHRAGLHLRCPGIYYRNGIAGSGGPDYFRNDYEWCIVFSKHRKKLPWADNTACGHPPKWAPGGSFSHRLPDGKRVNGWGSTGHSSGPRRPNGERQIGARPSHVYTKVGTLRKPHGGKQTRTYAPPKLANPGNVVKALYTAEDVAYLLAQAGVPGFGDVMHCLVGGGLMGDRLAHDSHAPMALDLAHRYIASFVPPGGLVYDPFGGSGTTAKAALLLGRKALLSELDEEMLPTIRQRLQGITPELYGDLVKHLARFDDGKEDPLKIAEALARRLLENDSDAPFTDSETPLRSAQLPATDSPGDADVPAPLVHGPQGAARSGLGDVPNGTGTLAGRQRGAKAAGGVHGRKTSRD